MKDYIDREYGHLKGVTIVGVRPLVKAEMDDLYWDESPYSPAFVLMLSNGEALIPSSDPEGNSPGHLIIADAQ